MIIETEIPDNQITRINEANKLRKAVPLDENGDPKYTDLVWFKMWVREAIIDMVAKQEWLERERQNQLVKDETIVTPI